MDRVDTSTASLFCKHQHVHVCRRWRQCCAIPCIAERLCTRAVVVGTDSTFSLSFISAKPYAVKQTEQDETSICEVECPEE
jgi:hypothetical protein